MIIGVGLRTGVGQPLLVYVVNLHSQLAERGFIVVALDPLQRKAGRRRMRERNGIEQSLGFFVFRVQGDSLSQLRERASGIPGAQQGNAQVEVVIRVFRVSLHSFVEELDRVFSPPA